MATLPLASRLSRRSLLTGLVISGASAALAACSSGTSTGAGSSTPASSAAAAATTAPAPTSAAAATSAPASAAATATPAAAATTAPAAQAASSAGKTEIQFYSPATDKLGNKIIAELADGYNKQSTKATVKVITVPTSNHYQKYVTAIAGGQSPDAIMTYDYTPIVDWASQGFILPMDDYQKSMGIKESDYFPVAWQMIFFHGHLWGFIQEFDFDILAWNTDMFTKAGLDPTKGPQTTDELDKMAEQLTVKDASGNLTQIGFCPWITSNTLTWSAIFGGKYYDAGADKWTISTDQNIATFDWYLKYVKLLGGPDKVTTFQKLFTGNQTPFYSNQLAIEGMGEYTPITVPDQAPKLKFANGWLPTASGVKFGTDQTGGGNVFVLPKGAPHQDLGVDFMSYMGGNAAVLQWNVEENNVPPVQSVAFDPNFTSKVPLMKDWIDVLKQNMMVPPATSPIDPFFEDNLSTARDSIIYGKMTPKAALDDLAKKVDDQLSQFKASHPNW